MLPVLDKTKVSCEYKLAVSFHRCRAQRNRYLADCCVPVSEGNQHLRSASRRKLNIPPFRRVTVGARAFSVAGETV